MHMTRHQLWITAILLIAGIHTVAQAQTLNQERMATVQLKDGTTIRGEFQDIQNDTLYLRPSVHDQRRIDVNRVAMIDFAGNAKNLPKKELTEAAKASSLAILKSGEQINGRLANVEHENEGEQAVGGAVTFTFDTANGNRHVPVEQLTRVYFGRYEPPMAAKRAAAKKSATEVVVPATQPWTPTGIQVLEGQMVAFEATGEISLSAAGDLARPAGSTGQKYASTAPLPQNLAGALIGRVGSTTFGIGNQTEPLRMPEAGTLLLGINDDRFDDNGGEFTVTITKAGGPTK